MTFPIAALRPKGGAVPFAVKALPGLKQWVEADLSPLWAEAARTTPVTTDGTEVDAADDLSGNGKHMTQAVASRGFVLKTGIKNGRQVLRGTTASNTNLANASFAQSQPLTVCIAFSVRTLGAGGSADIVFAGTTNEVSFNVATTPRSELYAGGSLSYNTAICNTVWGVATVIFNGASSKLYENGTQRAAGDVSSNNFSAFGVGGFAASRCVSADFGGWVVLAGVPSVANQIALENYFIRKWT